MDQKNDGDFCLGATLLDESVYRRKAANRANARLEQIISELDMIKSSSTTRERVSKSIDVDRVANYVHAKIEAEKEASALESEARSAEALLDCAVAGLGENHRAVIEHERMRMLSEPRRSLTRADRKFMGKAAAMRYERETERLQEQERNWWSEHCVDYVVTCHAVGAALRGMGIQDCVALRNRL